MDHGDAQNHTQLSDESRSYYGADDRLMVQNRHLGAGAVSAPGGVFEEYRYDALGRRVFVRSRRTNGCAVGFQCGAYAERTVWDGDQALYEIRAGGTDSVPWPIMEDDNGIGYGYGEQDWYGRVAYTHAHGIDQPVGLSRYTAGTWTWLSPLTNWQGDYTYGVLANGNTCPGSPGCPPANWPGNTTTADGGAIGGPGSPSAWLGNLIANKADGSGLQYLRNRYYDPATGRFTQSDPIGLAGGMNLYGFASGDPVNFSDPFGLCPDDNLNCELLKAAAQITGGILGGIGGFFIGGAAGAPSGAGALVTSMAGAGAFGTATAIASGRLVDMAFAMSDAGPSSGDGGGGSGPGGSAGGGAGPTFQESQEFVRGANHATPGLNRIVSNWFRNGGELPSQVTRQYLEHYRNIAQDVIRRGLDKSGIQAGRLDMINKVLQ